MQTRARIHDPNKKSKTKSLTDDTANKKGAYQEGASKA